MSSDLILRRLKKILGCFSELFLEEMQIRDNRNVLHSYCKNLQIEVKAIGSICKGFRFSGALLINGKKNDV